MEIVENRSKYFNFIIFHLNRDLNLLGGSRGQPNHFCRRFLKQWKTGRGIPFSVKMLQIVKNKLKYQYWIPLERTFQDLLPTFIRSYPAPFVTDLQGLKVCLKFHDGFNNLREEKSERETEREKESKKEREREGMSVHRAVHGSVGRSVRPSMGRSVCPSVHWSVLLSWK